MVANYDSFIKFFLCLLIGAFTLLVSPETTAQTGKPTLSSVFVKIHGMVCQFCAQGIRKNMKKVAGVTDVKVDMKTKWVTITGTQPVSDKTIKSVISDAGMTVVEINREEKKLPEKKKEKALPKAKDEDKHDHDHGHDHGKHKH